MDTSPIRSPLDAEHRAAGARFADFAGWSMPLRFTGTLAEHTAVRSDLGVFDVSHLGTVWITGAQAEAVVAATFTRDPAPLEPGGSQYTLCCDEQGGIVDDLLVYRLGPTRFVTMPNAANTAAVVAALRTAAQSRDAEVADASTRWAVLAVQGPRSLAVVDEVLAGLGVVGAPAATTPHLGVRCLATSGTGLAVGAPDAEVGAELLVCRTGYTGERGVELLIPAPAAAGLWRALRVAGAVACGLGARDTLRLEMGYPLHGHELSRDTTPFEARLGWAVQLDRGTFRGATALAAARRAGVRHRSWGLVLDGRRPARAGLTVHAANGARVVGRTTSGTLSPTLSRPIALAALDPDLSPGEEVEVDLRGRRTAAQVVRPPFVDRDPRA